MRRVVLPAQAPAAGADLHGRRTLREFGFLSGRSGTGGAWVRVCAEFRDPVLLIRCFPVLPGFVFGGQERRA